MIVRARVWWWSVATEVTYAIWLRWRGFLWYSDHWSPVFRLWLWLSLKESFAALSGLPKEERQRKIDFINGKYRSKEQVSP